MYSCDYRYYYCGDYAVLCNEHVLDLSSLVYDQMIVHFSYIAYHYRSKTRGACLFNGTEQWNGTMEWNGCI